MTNVDLDIKILINALTYAQHGIEKAKKRATNPNIQELLNVDIQKIEHAILQLRKEITGSLQL